MTLVSDLASVVPCRCGWCVNVELCITWTRPVTLLQSRSCSSSVIFAFGVILEWSADYDTSCVTANGWI